MSQPQKTSQDRTQDLALALPCLRSAPGASPWDAVALDDWAASGLPSHGERCAAMFLLAVWNPAEDWQSGRFDVMDALGVWDPPHRRVFLTWAQDP